MKKGNSGTLAAIRLLLVRDYLTANASKTQVVRRKGIEDYLAEKGFFVEKKTIFRDLDTLRVDFGLDLSYDERKKGYYLLNPPFEPYELRLMVDSVQASKFITQKTANEITAKVKKLAGKATKDSIPAVFYRHYPAHQKGNLTISELARACDLSRTTICKYISLLDA